jgi:Holliday junction resolvase RusA-like endonuclease
MKVKMARIKKEEVLVDKEIVLIIDQTVIDKYNKYYFKKYPGRRKEPIEAPTHPSINKWMILRRPQMNGLKQNYKEFIVWFIQESGLTNRKIKKCEMTFISYFRTKVRKDVDNTVPKFTLDGFTEAGLIEDDDFLHLESITLKCGYDKDNPRTEIYIYFKE